MAATVCGFVPKIIPCVWVPARYLSICFAAVQWHWSGLSRYQLRRLMAKQISGRVLVAAYCSEPMSSQYGMSVRTLALGSGCMRLTLGSKGVVTGFASAIPKQVRTLLMYSVW